MAPPSTQIQPLLTDVTLYKQKSVTYKSECIDEFSLDKEHRLQLGRNELKFLYEEMLDKPLNIDLTEGFENGVDKKRDESQKKIFDWLMAVAAKGASLTEAVHGAEFVSRRGLLSRLASAPFDVQSRSDYGQTVACVKYKGVYFLREFQKEAKERATSESENASYQKQMSYVGFKFEQLMTSNEPYKMPNTNASVDPNAEFNGVFTATLSATGGRSLKLLCAAEIDCILANGHEYIELKTQQFGRFGEHFPVRNKGFQFKALKWYLQSYLVGIKKTAIGFHDKCVLKRVELHQLEEMLKYTGDVDWNVAVCLCFLYTFLEKIKRELDATPEGSILVCKRAAGARQFTFQLIGLNDLARQSEWKVVSDEFKAHGWQ